MKIHLRHWGSILAGLFVCLAIGFNFHTVWAFAEELLYFIDPANGQPTDEEVSTIHNDLTYVLALAAGFSEADSRSLQIYDQLVDSTTLGPGADVVYTNCTGAAPAAAPSKDTACAGVPALKKIKQIWPMQPASACFTDRFSVYSPFFHFPGQAEIAELKNWAWGSDLTLNGYAAYAWGETSDLEGAALRAECRVVQDEVIQTGMTPGSLAAFGTYLHSLADYYSHRDCMTAIQEKATLGEIAAPWWGTHTLGIQETYDIYECNYNPNNYQVDDAHGREFGTAYPEDAARTHEAIQAVYAELSLRSLAREGQWVPLPLDTPLSLPAGVAPSAPAASTLGELLEQFVTNWDYFGEENRRDLAAAMASAITGLSGRQPPTRVYLPAMTR